MNEKGEGETLDHLRTWASDRQDGAGRWLWWALGPGDLAGSLGRAVVAFRSKDWTGGAAPAIVKAAPELAGSLASEAAAAGLAVVPDLRVQPGTVYLGFGQKGGER